MQTFDVTKPISGTTKFSQLYQIIRDHDQANQCNFSGATAPTSPVVGQLWEDTANDKLFLYTTASGWSEVAVENIGLGLELKAARGSHASLDSRLDAQLNEDGTLKAATTLNPSQWYDLTVASGYVSTTSFRAFGADYTSVYYPTRRLKVNNAGGASYTEVVSSSYSAPNTTVVVRDAVVAATLNYVSHSIVGPKRASYGDGAVSYEMIGNKNVASPTTTYSVLVGDSIILASGTFTVTGPVAALFGAGRDLIIINIGTGNITYDPNSTETINGSTTSLVLGPGQSLSIVCDGSNWKRIDTPVCEGWSAASGVMGTGWSTFSGATVEWFKNPMGVVHLKGKIACSLGGSTLAYTFPSGYRPTQILYFCNQEYSGGITVSSIRTDGGVYINGAPGADVYINFDGLTFKAA